MTKAEREKNVKCPNRITLIERDIIRSLIVPKDTNRKFTTLVTQSQFEQIKENSQVSMNDTIPT